MVSRRRKLVPLAALVPVLLSCGGRDPVAPPLQQSIGTWPPGLRQTLGLGDGRWAWRWRGADGAHGAAELEIVAERFIWRLADPPPAGPLSLASESERWLPVRVADPAQLGDVPPLPSLACDSPAFADLVSLLRHLITPRFEGRITHWPRVPVPVSAPEAVSGGLDLAACLREAVEIWNERIPFFVWDPDADWGVRLAHYAGGSRSPPMQLQLTRLDAAGRPLRARIAVGDDYDARGRDFARRALAHELGHALLLWGHSPDRGHLLWGAAPPLRADPSDDEVRAAALLRLLPEGLDLTLYGRTEDGSDRSSSRQGSSVRGRPSSSGATSRSPARASPRAASARGPGNAPPGTGDSASRRAARERSASSMVRSSQLRGSR
jgi:hypothetical protein